MTTLARRWGDYEWTLCLKPEEVSEIVLDHVHVLVWIQQNCGSLLGQLLIQ